MFAAGRFPWQPFTFVRFLEERKEGSLVKGIAGETERRCTHQHLAVGPCGLSFACNRAHWRSSEEGKFLSTEMVESRGDLFSKDRGCFMYAFLFFAHCFWALFLPSSNMQVPAAPPTMPRTSWGHKLRTWEGKKGEFSFLEVVDRIW